MADEEVVRQEIPEVPEVPETPEQPEETPSEQPEQKPEEQAGETAAPAEQPEPATVPRSQFNETAYRLRKANEQLRKLSQPVGAAQPYQFSQPEPKWDQFEHPEEFVKAHDEWSYSKRAHQSHAHAAQEAQQEVAQATATLVSEKLRQGKKAFPDFEKTLRDGGLYDDASGGLVEAMLDSDHFPQVAYYIAKHPEERERLADLTPVAQAREIGKLEVKLLAETTIKQKQDTKPTKVETAGAGNKPKPEVDLKKEFEKARQTGDWGSYILAKNKYANARQAG